MSVDKWLKIRVYRLLDKYGKLIKEPCTKYIDEGLFKDFLKLVKQYEKKVKK